MAKLIHTMVRVKDLGASIDFYGKAFGMRESHRLDFPGFTLVYLRSESGDAEIELTLNKDREDAYTHGSGYGHVAFAVEDLEGTHARLKNAGMAPGDIKSLKHGDTLAARFFFISDPDDYKIEVLAAEGHYR